MQSLMNCKCSLYDWNVSWRILTARSRLVLGGLVGGEGNQRLSPSLTDVYLLSLPAFSWIKLNDSTTQMRASGKCKVIGNRQMLVIGGHDPSSSNFGTTPDSFANGLGIFDMSNLSWSDGYDPQAPEYLRPSLVNDYYAHKYAIYRIKCYYEGSSHRRSTQSPTWNSPQVQSLFETSAVATTPSTSPSTPPGRPKPRGHKAVGLIVGVVIGIVVAVSSLLLLGYWLTKRRRRRANPQIKPAPNPKYEVGTSPTHELEQPVGELESGFQPAVLQHHEMEAPQRIPR